MFIQHADTTCKPKSSNKSKVISKSGKEKLDLVQMIK